MSYLSLVPGREPLNPWNFLGNKNIFVFQEPHGSYLKDHVIRWLEFWVSSTSRERIALKTEFYHMANFSIMPTQWNYNKNFVHHTWLNSLVGENSNVMARWQTLLPRELVWKLHLWNPSEPHAIYLFHLSGLNLYHL